MREEDRSGGVGERRKGIPGSKPSNDRRGELQLYGSGCGVESLPGRKKKRRKKREGGLYDYFYSFLNCHRRGSFSPPLPGAGRTNPYLSNVKGFRGELQRREISQEFYDRDKQEPRERGRFRADSRRGRLPPPISLFLALATSISHYKLLPFPASPSHPLRRGVKAELSGIQRNPAKLHRGKWKKRKDRSAISS